MPDSTMPYWSVAIEDSFARGGVQGLPSRRLSNWNLVLPGCSGGNQNPPRGIYIGEDGAFNLYVEELGAASGEITPYLNIVGGILHSIRPRMIVNTGRYTTTARNILVIY